MPVAAASLGLDLPINDLRLVLKLGAEPGRPREAFRLDQPKGRPEEPCSSIDSQYFPDPNNRLRSASASSSPDPLTPRGGYKHISLLLSLPSHCVLSGD